MPNVALVAIIVVAVLVIGVGVSAGVLGYLYFNGDAFARESWSWLEVATIHLSLCV